MMGSELSPPKGADNQMVVTSHPPGSTQGVEINEHSAFTPDITPIILAAHKDNFECYKLLYDK